MKQTVLSLAFIIFSFAGFTQTTKEVYNPPGYDTVLTNQWNGSAWIPNKRSIYTSNAQCLTTSELVQNWQTGSSAWVNFTLHNITYTSDSQTSLDLQQSWDQASSTWTTAARTVYTYNSDHLKATISTDLFTSGAWQPQTLLTFSYNADQTVNQYVTQIYAASTTFYARSTFSYNPNKSVSQVANESSTNGTTWVPTSRSTFTYNGGSNKIATILTQSWVVNAYVNSTLQTSSYDGNSYLINTVAQNWNSATSTWVNNTQGNYTNNGTGLVIQLINQQWTAATSSFTNQTQTFYHYGCSNVVLPLTLTGFSASKSSAKALLSWQTANETNTDHFVIQRSFDGVNFTDIGSVNVHPGNGGADNYSYTDHLASVNKSTIYYRLQVVDNDGKISNSKIITMFVNGNEIGFDIKPNPAHNFFVITTTEGNADITINSLSGLTIIKKHISSAGEQRLDISSLSKGIYMVTVKSVAGIKTVKLAVE